MSFKRALPDINEGKKVSKVKLGRKSKTEKVIVENSESDSDGSLYDEDSFFFQVRAGYRVQVFVDLTDPNNYSLKLSSVHSIRGYGRDYCDTYRLVEGEQVIYTERQNTNFRLFRLFEIEFEELSSTSSSVSASECGLFLLSRVMKKQYRKDPAKYLGLSPRSFNTEVAKYAKHLKDLQTLKAKVKSLWKTDIFEISFNTDICSVFKDIKVTTRNFYNIHCTREDIAQLMKTNIQPIKTLPKVFKNLVKHDDRLSCGYCDRSYMTQKSLTKHLSISHHKKANFICSICKFYTHNSVTYQTHFSKHPAFDCPKCKIPFTNNKNRKTHQKSSCPGKIKQHSAVSKHSKNTISGSS